MDCSEFCANFKPKPGPPFPDTLRTTDLEKGMLVESNHGSRYVILESPSDEQVKVLIFWKGYAREKIVWLGDDGCQPYRDGKWNQSNWLREVK